MIGRRFLASVCTAVMLLAAGCSNSDTLSETGSEPLVSESSASEIRELAPVSTDNFTFTAVTQADYSEQLEKIQEEKGDVIILGNLERLCTEHEYGCEDEECIEFLGREWTLFGTPVDPGNNEDLFSYFVSAEAKDGRKCCLAVCQYSNLPSIDGPVIEGYEICADAAKELAELIRNTEISEFEWVGNGTYSENGIEIIYSYKGGKAFVESYLYGLSNDEIEEKFSSMSEEKFNEWLEKQAEIYYESKK